MWRWASDHTLDIAVPVAAGVRVIRGGAWYYSCKLARCAAREGVKPTYVSASLGFRLALSLPDVPPKKPASGV